MTTLAPPKGIRTIPDGLPERSIGWRLPEWSYEYLLQPDGPEAGEPWHFTPEQARFIIHWYSFDEHGRFVYRSGVYRRLKGGGKNPFAAALCCIEFIGPCRPTLQVDRNGYPVGERHLASWIQTAAVSREQTRNMMTLMPSMLSQRAIEEYGIDLGKEIIYASQGRQRMEAVTSSPRASIGDASRRRVTSGCLSRSCRHCRRRL